ncbi:MAG: class I SAM-dependent methyltransferase [Candidatus Saccharibacteria bacterium]|nr:class I SAM-dependent methyltransferase [Candidatus Saccharibacteria bacterium]
MTPKAKRDSVKESYNLIAAQYGKDFGTFIEDIDVYETFEKELPKGATILDLGAGTGRTYAYFNKKGYEYIGLDFSPKMKDEAFKIHGEFPYILEDMVNVRNHFKDNSVDAVFAVYSLFHLPKDDLRKVLSDVYDILKEKGIILMSYQLGDGEEFTDEPYLGESGKKKLYISYQAKDEMDSILKSLGFVDIYKKEKVETVDGAIKNNATTVFRLMRKI